MADVVQKGTLFAPQLVTHLIDNVKGKSALAKLCNSTPIPFNGKKEFVFTMDDEVDIVAEGGKKSRGSAKLDPVVVLPLKIEYGARVTDEFLYATEEEKISILQSFNEGFQKKAAKALDLMAIHGINPRTGTASSIIGNNCFDKAVTQIVTTGSTPDEKVESAISLIQGSEYEATGMAMAPLFRSELSKMTRTDGSKVFPELAWGNAPGQINGLPVQVNAPVAAGTTDLAVLGDFESMFQWGYAKEIPMEVIEYGDPDNSGMDLKGYNQVYLRCELYLGWGIMDPNAFALIQSAS